MFGINTLETMRVGYSRILARNTLGPRVSLIFLTLLVRNPSNLVIYADARLIQHEEKRLSALRSDSRSGPTLDYLYVFSFLLPSVQLGRRFTFPITVPRF